MIFLDNQTKDQVQHYEKLLKILGSISNLFSESSTPYLHYRATENLFCKSFQAKNLSRSDVSADASKEKIGIGIKTFIEGNGNTWQKVAEFNKDNNRFKDCSDEELVDNIAFLRNERINTTKRIHDLDELIYHCITRNTSKFRIYEENMDLIQGDQINKITHERNIIKFTDDQNEYSFNKSKSTLYKKFKTPKNFIDINVKFLVNPFEELESIFETYLKDHLENPHKTDEFILLPLYSDRSQIVERKSGLNAWNGGGRARDFDEVYIPIPKWIHRTYPNFLPKQDKPFDMVLPDGSIMSCKVCQQGSKALMSNPNKALGKWLLRDVLNLKQGEILTKDKLSIIGLDSIAIYKTLSEKYSINFTKSGSYEEFKSSALINEKSNNPR